MYSLETKRLILRPLTWNDFDFFAALYADPDVSRFLGSGTTKTDSESRELLQRILHSYSEDGAGQLGVCLKDSDILIGRCGLTVLEVEANPEKGELPRWFWFRGTAPSDIKIVREMELGYTFARKYWGNGFATESASAVRDFAFETCAYARLLSGILPDNEASKNVAKKVGMKHIGPIRAFGVRAEGYEIARAD